MKYIVSAAEAPSEAPLGGKVAALAALAHTDLPIPPWVALTPAAFQASLTPAQNEALQTVITDASLRSLLEQATVGPEVCAELQEALARLCPQGEPVAVRSSALDEDGSQHSFAGQLDSFLFVPPAAVAKKVVAVWRSAFSERLMTYRRKHGLSLVPRAPAVLIQRMVRADTAGVAFGVDPVSGRRAQAVVSAVLGLGTALVAGEVDADTYHVDRDGRILQRTIADKRFAHRPAPGTAEGVKVMPLPEELATSPALSDEQVAAVAELVRRTGRFFGRPQDIEWAMEDGRLYLLQSRPITTLAHTSDPDGVLNLWDNSNIAESYSGITTPLTFSFARSIYEEVYRQFCRLLSVPEAALAENNEIFRHMLGLIRGRVYYNLFNWYRLLALLPGFTMNRRFMEQMMGVKEGLPDDLAAELRQATWKARFTDSLRFLGSVLALGHKHLTLPGLIRRFYRRLDAALGPRCPDLSLLRPDELLAYYRNLERQLLTHWDAPLVNDFLAMIFFGMLRQLAARWCPDGGANLHNDLLCGEGGMISAEPAARVRALAECARTAPELTEALCEGSPAAIRQAQQKVPAFAPLYQAYLDKFGDRCLEELKLESPTLHDDPLPLLRSVGRLARRLSQQGGEQEERSRSPEQAERRHAEEKVRTALRWRPLRRLLFSWVLRHARARVRDRENLRFERTRLFGRVRRILLEMGRRFHEMDLIDQPRDVFYLEVNEVLGFIDGTITCADLRGLIGVRRAEFERYARREAPADRFETRGVVLHGQSYQNRAAVEETDGEERQGLGCCPGVVRGRVRVVHDPRGTELRVGEILVAERTDPGWIMLFPAAAGLLVERGSLLSHSAIVAREMGIPAIVSLRGVTRWLKDGDQVELDGARGVVRRIRVD